MDVFPLSLKMVSAKLYQTNTKKVVLRRTVFIIKKKHLGIFSMTGDSYPPDSAKNGVLKRFLLFFVHQPRGMHVCQHGGCICV